MKETSGGKVKGNERKQLVTMMNNKRGRHIEHKIKIDRYEEMRWIGLILCYLFLSFQLFLVRTPSLSLCSLACASLSERLRIYASWLPPQKSEEHFHFHFFTRLPTTSPLQTSMSFPSLFSSYNSCHLSFDLYIFLC